MIQRRQFLLVLVLGDKNLRQIGKHLGNGRVVQLTLLEGVVRHDLALIVKNNRDVRFFSHVVLFRACGIVDRKDALLEAFLFGQRFQLVAEFLVLGHEDHKAPHFGFAVLGGFGVNLLDQTGQGAADFACEDHRDRVATVLSDKAVFFSRLAAGNIERMERTWNVLADRRAGLEGITRHHAGNGENGNGEDPHRYAMFHRGNNLLLRDSCHALQRHFTK